MRKYYKDFWEEKENYNTASGDKNSPYMAKISEEITVNEQ